MLFRSKKNLVKKPCPEPIDDIALKKQKEINKKRKKCATPTPYTGFNKGNGKISPNLNGKASLIHKPYYLSNNTRSVTPKNEMQKKGSVELSHSNKYHFKYFIVIC